MGLKAKLWRSWGESPCRRRQ